MIRRPPRSTLFPSDALPISAPTKEHLATVLQAAVRAPDHGRLRPWRFMLIEGDQRKDRKSTRLNSSHSSISYAVFCLKKKNRIHKRKCSDHRSDSAGQNDD